jgi:antitoxin PrlF
MTTATINSKGQITIPTEVRQALALEADDRVEFVQIEPGRFLLVVANRSVTELKSMFGKATRSVSIEEMDHAIAMKGASAQGNGPNIRA